MAHSSSSEAAYNPRVTSAKWEKRWEDPNWKIVGNSRGREYGVIVGVQLGSSSLPQILIYTKVNLYMLINSYPHHSLWSSSVFVQCIRKRARIVYRHLRHSFLIYLFTFFVFFFFVFFTNYLQQFRITFAFCLLVSLVFIFTKNVSILRFLLCLSTACIVCCMQTFEQHCANFINLSTPFTLSVCVCVLVLVYFQLLLIDKVSFIS